MKRAFVLVMALLGAGTASAELIEKTPAKACALLADSGLKGRKWVDDYGDGSAGCASDYKDIGPSGSGLANNIAYYVIGVNQYVMEAKLVLNYNQPSKSAPATKALLSAAQKLSQRALGVPLPNSVAELITQGESGSEKVGKGAVQVVREEWPTGKGYEVQVMMQ